MRHLVKHLWETNQAEIIARSRRNCHVRGLHSVMLSECPGKTIRLFVADWNHELYHNTLAYDRSPLSMAVHPHHCPITLVCTLGFFVNQDAYIVKDCLRAIHFWPEFQQFIFDSKLKGGTGGFVPGEPEPHRYQPNTRKVSAGGSLHMTPKQLHTVYVPREERAAWFVFEGPSDPDYKPICYSNRDLTQFSPEGLYEQPEEKEIRRWLEIAGML
jgi:hypothetical protein